jgi:cold-inducible RNA-binding protein
VGVQAQAAHGKSGGPENENSSYDNSCATRH